MSEEKKRQALGEPTGRPSDEASSPRPADRAIILGQLPRESTPAAGSHAPSVVVLRQRAEGAPLEAGIVRPMKDGESIHEELVTLKPTREGSRVCDVEVHVDARPSARRNAQLPAQLPAQLETSHAGPSRVTSERYRTGWEQVFGDRSTRESN